ncbi:hypothetical protein Glove_196g9 [Diversispora epigaea]|uniref:Uncharacterized protein n=1 Tax=Diversispora epigaea TaxID=1348612 RepID=A0A397IKZ5_9GLOM|nr:hypothetical protein Glove_196g8 [Diversispora epigaea]RHZ76546.1 hypothetical protein Glove_196g9 [Diversispora epigaea]
MFIDYDPINNANSVILFKLDPRVFQVNMIHRSKSDPHVFRETIGITPHNILTEPTRNVVAT